MVTWAVVTCIVTCVVVAGFVDESGVACCSLLITTLLPKSDVLVGSSVCSFL